MHLTLADVTLSDALVILTAAGIIIPAFARFRITPVIGYILVGIAVGPHGLGSLVSAYPWLYYVTITDEAAITPFAEFGIILLLFTIGLELSFRRLWSMRKQVFGLGAAELVLGGLVIAAALMLAGWSTTAAMGLGFALTLSSTALVLPIAGTSGRVGQNAFAMLLFEDLALVPIIFVLGAFAPSAGDGAALDNLFRTLWQGFAMVAVLGVVGWFMLPRLFAQAARTKDPELFLAASLLVVIVAALATTSVGLSPIVGALMAGLMISETEYHGEVEVLIAPFKGLALGLFLITVGMSVNLLEIIANWPTLLLAVVGIIAIKTIVTAVLLRMAKARIGVATEVGLLMASPSETTLIVLGTAVAAGIVSREDAAFWQVVTAIGMTVTPILAAIGHKLARRIDTQHSDDLSTTQTEPMVLIVGFGRVGQVIADLLSAHGKRYMAVEADIDAVARAQEKGYRVRFTDAARPQVLDALDDLPLSAVVLTMDDPVQQVQLTRRLRARFPDLPIITRARDIKQAGALYRAGANDAVPEALEGSLQLAEAVLVDIGIGVGPVIASIHDHRAKVRQEIMDKGGLSEEPASRLSKPRSSTLI